MIGLKQLLYENDISVRERGKDGIIIGNASRSNVIEYQHIKHEKDLKTLINYLEDDIGFFFDDDIIHFMKYPSIYIDDIIIQKTDNPFLFRAMMNKMIDVANFADAKYIFLLASSYVPSGGGRSMNQNKLIKLYKAFGFKNIIKYPKELLIKTL